MKILITTDLYSPTINGVVTSVLNLKEELEKMGNEVRVLTLSNKSYSYYKNGVYYIKSFPLKIYPGVRATVSFRDPVIKSAINFKPDLIHTQCEFSTLVIAKIIARKIHCPIVHTYHTMYEYYVKYITRHDKPLKKALKSIMHRLLEKCDVLIAPTEKVKNSLRSYGLKNKIAVIPTGIDLSVHKKSFDLDDIKNLKKSLGIDLHKKVLLFLGRIAQEKNLLEIVYNFKYLVKDDDSFVLLIAGDGPYKKELENIVSEFNLERRVFFTGMIKPSDTYKYYRLSDIFISASNSETQGLTYIEAMVNGLPEVVKYDDCLKGLLEEGKNGFYFSNAEEFKRGINKIFENSEIYTSMKKNAMASGNKYSKEEFAKSVFEVYKSAIKNYKIPKKYSTLMLRKIKIGGKRQFRKLKKIPLPLLNKLKNRLD